MLWQFADPMRYFRVHSSAIPVTFKQKLKNQEAVEEGSVTLRCELSKLGVPVEWRKDAQLLTEGDKYQIKQEGRMAELLIRNLTLTDLGEYSCFVGTVVTSADIKVRGRFYTKRHWLAGYWLFSRKLTFEMFCSIIFCSNESTSAVFQLFLIR